jgi:hypothetical protein
MSCGKLDIMMKQKSFFICFILHGFQPYDFRIYSYNACITLGYIVFTSAKNIFLIVKTHCAISCAVNFYNAGVVSQGRRIGSRLLLAL